MQPVFIEDNSVAVLGVEPARDPHPGQEAGSSQVDHRAAQHVPVFRRKRQRKVRADCGKKYFVLQQVTTKRKVFNLDLNVNYCCSVTRKKSSNVYR